MKTYEVTMTSKNQITIPAEVVRSLKLSKNRVFEMKIKDNELSLTPEQDILEKFRPYWSKHKAKRAISVEEMNEFIRTGIAERASKS